MALEIKEIVEMFTEDLERENHNRDAAQDDIKFAKLGEQWPEEVKSAREAEGRPCLTINRCPSFVRQIVNDSRINTPQIKVKPVDDEADPETAEVLSGLIKNIEYSSQADTAYDTALDSSASCGMGFFKVTTEYCDDESFAQDLFIRRITNPLSIVFDSYAESIDGSDWNHASEIEWLKKAQFERKYGKNKSAVSFAGDASDHMQDVNDTDLIRIVSFWYVNEEEEKILMLSDGSVVTEADFKAPHPEYGIPIKDLIADMGFTVSRERKRAKRTVKQYICGAEIIETNDWAGKYIPIIPVFGEEVFSKGKRYLKSLIRDAKDPQRMFNYWRTSSTELVALAPKTPFIGPAGSFDTDADKWATANVKSHPFIEYDNQGIPPQRQPFVGTPAGVLQEALNASDDMKAIMGLYDASLGARSNETSGKAINARKQEGDVSTFHFIDNLSKSIAHCGRVLVDLIPKIYDTERVIRIIGVDGETKNVPLKQQTEYNGVQRIFDPSVGKYDVAVDTGPSFTTQREEAANQMIELIRGYPDAAPIIGDLLAKNLNWPDADEISKRLKAMLPPQIQALEENGMPPEAMLQINQLKQQMQAMGQQMQQGLGEFQKVVDELNKMKADRTLEMRKLDNDAYAKETDRIKVNAEVGNMVANQIAQAQSLYRDPVQGQPYGEPYSTQQDTPSPQAM